MKKYLITGFSGFVGYHFISHLNDVVGEKVSVLGLDIVEPRDYNEWVFEKVDIQFKIIDLRNYELLQLIIQQYKPDYILHLAAYSSVNESWKDPAGCFINNTQVFLNILEAIRIGDIDCKLLCIGSSEEYGFVPEDSIPITEKTSITPSNPYAVSKVAQEGMAKCYVDKYSINTCLTRSFNHIGPRQKDSFVIASFCKQVASAHNEGLKELHMTTGNLNIVRDFLDVRDVVSAYYMILHNGKPGDIYNVCSGIGYNLHDVVTFLKELSGISIETKLNPEFLRPNDMAVFIGDNSKLRHDTGWKQKYTMKDSLIDIYNYWIKQLQ